jgi:hypothetical protein
VLTSAIINTVFALLGFLLFSWLRVWKKSELYFAPKRTTPAVRVKPAELPQSFFGWIGPVFAYSEPDIIRVCGVCSNVMCMGCRKGARVVGRLGAKNPGFPLATYPYARRSGHSNLPATYSFRESLGITLGREQLRFEPGLLHASSGMKFAHAHPLPPSAPAGSAAFRGCRPVERCCRAARQHHGKWG